MNHSQDLKRLLESIDHKGYPAYKAVQGSYDFKDYILTVDHVQGDPFASPSKVSVFIPHKINAFPEGYYDRQLEENGTGELSAALFQPGNCTINFKAKGSGKSGLIATSRPGQEVLTRSACECTEPESPPALKSASRTFGRTINSGELIKILFEFSARMRQKCLYV